MPTIVLAGYTVDSAIVAKVDASCASNGLPVNVGRAHVLAESGGFAGSRGDGGTSWGLLNLHQGGGQGDGYTVAQLQDPDTNLRIGMPIIAAAWRANGNLTGRQRILRTAAESGHPNDPDKFPVGSLGRQQSLAGINRVADIWATLEGVSPSPMQDTSLAGVPTARVSEVIDTAVAFAHAHPVAAAAVAVAVLVVLS